MAGLTTAEVHDDDTWAGGRELMEVCGDFLARKCSRNIEWCKFAHPEAGVRQVAKQVHVCLDSLMKMKKCAFRDCKYYHPPSHIQFTDVVKGRIDLCTKFMEDDCFVDECPMAHPEKDEQIVKYVAICDVEDCSDVDCVYYHLPPTYGADNNDICYDFSHGKCNRGSNCKFSHDEPVGGRRPGGARSPPRTAGRRREFESPSRPPLGRRRSRSPALGAPRARPTSPEPARRRQTMEPSRRERSPMAGGKGGPLHGPNIAAMFGGKGAGKSSAEMLDYVYMMCTSFMSTTYEKCKGDPDFANKLMTEFFAKAKANWNASSSAGKSYGDYATASYAERRSSPHRDDRPARRERTPDRVAPRDHRDHDDRNPARQADDRRGSDRVTCRDWINRKCDRGSNCRFEHVRI